MPVWRCGAGVGTPGLINADLDRFENNRREKWGSCARRKALRPPGSTHPQRELEQVLRWNILLLEYGSEESSRQCPWDFCTSLLLLRAKLLQLFQGFGGRPAGFTAGLFRTEQRFAPPLLPSSNSDGFRTSLMGPNLMGGSTG